MAEDRNRMRSRSRRVVGLRKRSKAAAAPATTGHMSAQDRDPSLFVFPCRDDGQSVEVLMPARRRVLGLRKQRRGGAQNEGDDDDDDGSLSSCSSYQDSDSLPEAADDGELLLFPDDRSHGSHGSVGCGFRQGLMCGLDSLRRSASASADLMGHYHGAEKIDRHTKDSTLQTEAVSTGSCSTDSSQSSDDGEADFYSGRAGDVIQGNNRQYRIVRELGRGTFGRVVECHHVNPDDWKEQLGLGHWRGTLRAKTSGVFAIKIARNRPYCKRDTEVEADMLRRVNGTGGRGTELFPLLADHFCLPEGHSCLAFEKLGMSLHDIIKNNGHEPFEMTCVRDVAVQLFDALDHIHSLGIVHTDLKPENILIASNNTDEFDRRIKVIDFGSACFDKERNKPTTVNTRQYRAPEILLRIGWSFPSDIWAAGCTVAELHIASLLFPAKDDAEHLALMERIVGPFPRMMLRKSVKLAGPSGPARNFDVVRARHKMEEVLPPDHSAYVESSSTLKELAGDEGVELGLYDLLEAVFTIDPQRRPTAAKALRLASAIEAGSTAISPSFSESFASAS